MQNSLPTVNIIIKVQRVMEMVNNIPMSTDYKADLNNLLFEVLDEVRVTDSKRKEFSDKLYKIANEMSDNNKY